MSVSKHRSIHLKIECVELPEPDWGGHAEIWVGVQKRDEVVQAVKLPSEEVIFEVELKIVEGSTGAKPNFLGPFAHGTPQERFVYVCWGTQSSGSWHGFRRAKLSLSNLTWEDIRTGDLKVTLRCKDPKGGPVCASIKPERVVWASSISQ